MANHHHHHSHRENETGNIAIAFFLNLAFTVFEIVGGFYVNSIAILSDALHDLGDSFSLGTSWYLEKKSKQKPDVKYTFGYKRFSLLGALVNSVVLIVGSGFVLFQAVKRLIHPEHTDAKGMLLFAIVGVVVNGIAAWRLSKGKSLNQKVLSWHLMEDILGWAAVLIVSIVILFKDIHILDPLLSILITAYVVYNVIKRLKETLYIFLQGAPQEVDLAELKEKILSIPNIQSIHHTHLWSLDEHNQVFTIHLVLNNISSVKEITEIKNRVKDQLRSLDISHATIDMEFRNNDCYMGGERNEP